MAAQAFAWSLVASGTLVTLAWILRDNTLDLAKLWTQMLIGGFAVAAVNQVWWRLKKQSFQGWTE
jgi:hypothetical protein